MPQQNLFSCQIQSWINPCNCGGSGFSWWWFQDGYWNTSEPGSNHYGLLERGYVTPSSSGGGLPEKPLANVFDNYIPPASVSSCGPCPVTAAALQTYNPALTYFNPFQHPSNPQNTIKGYIYDQDGNPIANAYVGGHTVIDYDDLTGILLNSYQRVFTDLNGYFELIPYDYSPPFYEDELESKLHTLLITTVSGERIKYSEYWYPSNFCSAFMPPANDPSMQWNLLGVNYSYSGEFSNILIPSGVTRDMLAYHDLTVENATIESGAFSEIKAPESIQLKETFHATDGSEVHIYCTPTSINCLDYSGLIHMEYKIADNSSINFQPTPNYIDLEFVNIIPDKKWKIYPNPAISFFNIENNEECIAEIEIFNMLGELIAGFKMTDKTMKINCSQFPQGIYFVKASNSNQISKFIKQ